MIRKYRPNDKAVNIPRDISPLSTALSRDLSPVTTTVQPFLLSFNTDYYRVNGLRKPLTSALTHSRSGNATMVDSDGLIKWAPHNLLSYSEEFDNAYWGTASITVTADDTAAPDGTTTAEKLAVVGNGSPQSAAKDGIFTQTSTDYTLSIYAKAGTLSYFFLAYRGNSSNVAIAEWDLSTGTFNASNASGTAVINSTSITSVGSGWYRLVLSVTTSTGNTNARFAFGPTDGTFSNFGYYVGSTSGDAYAWGAHLYRSDLGGMVDVPAGERVIPSASTYVPTTSSARYLPRVGHHVYNGSSWVNEGVLAESEARTNLVTYSEDFTDADWTKVQATVTANTAVSPDGNTNGYKLDETSTTATNYFGIYENASLTSGATVTLSVFAKAGERDYIGLLVGPAGDYNGQYFNLSDGTKAGTEGSDFTSEIQDFGNGWYRCSVSYTPSATASGFQRIVISANGTTRAYAGTAGNGIYIYGAQVEAAPTPSSYIPTSGSTVTRAAETFTIPAANLPWPTETYGPELVTNGDFSNGTTGYFDVTGTVVSGEFVLGSIKQSISTTAGKLYRLTFDVPSLTTSTASAARVRIGSSSGSFDINQTYFGDKTAPTTVEVYFTAVSATTFFQWYVTTDSANIDNISVRELTRYPVSIQMNGRLSYADEGSAGQVTYAQWEDDTNNRITLSLDTDSTATGEVNFTQVEGGTADTVASSATEYAPGILVPFNIASRHGMTFINGAVDGVALTEDTTPTNLPDLSATDLELAYDYMGTVERFRVWGLDLGDGGIEGASS